MLNTNTIYTYYFTNRGLMLRTPRSWEEPIRDGIELDIPYSGHGDSLWRTGVAYICYGKEYLKEGIMSCYRKVIKKNGRYYYQASRSYDQYLESTVSRDQVTMSLASLYEKGDVELLKEYISHLRVRLSERHNMSADMFLWVKTLNGSIIAEILYNIFQFPVQLFIFGIDKLVIFLYRLKIKRFKVSLKKICYSQQDFIDDDSLYGIRLKSLTKWEQFWDKLKMNEYSKHLMAWQLYTMRFKLISRIFGFPMRLLLSRWVETDNYLCQLLLGFDRKITQEMVDNYKPMKGYRWSSRLDGIDMGSTRIITDPKISEFNQIDVDILHYIYDKHKKS
jgi:hypothetical protein